MHRLLALGLIGVLLASCSHTAGIAPPPSPLNAAGPVYGTQVTLGPCLGEAESGVVASLATTLISTGVNRIGAAIKSAAAAETTTALARRNIEISNRGPLGPCVYVARGWFHNKRPQFPDGSNPGGTYVIDQGSRFLYDDRAPRVALWSAGLYLAATPDFFFQGRLTPAEGNRAYTVTPKLAWLKTPLVANDLRSDERSVLLSFALVPLDKPASLEKGGSTVVLGRLIPGRTREYSQEDCVGRIRQEGEGVTAVQTATNCAGAVTAADYTVLRSSAESEWFTVGMTPDRQPMTLLALVTETRSASAFLGFVSDVFSAAQAPITTALTNEFVPSAAATAAETEVGAREALLTAFDTAYGTAATAMAECIATPAVAAKRTAARVALRNLIATARRASIDVSELTDLEISADGDDPRQCNDVRKAMLPYSPGGVSRLPAVQTGASGSGTG